MGHKELFSRFISLLAPATKHPPHLFAESKPLTLGVEVELQLVDPHTQQLLPRAEELLRENDKNPRIQSEVYQSMLEVVTGICADVNEVHKDLSESFDLLKRQGSQCGIGFATTATHPSAKYADAIPSEDIRYTKVIDRNQWLTRRWSVYGVHIHLGMKSGEDCIRFNNFLLRFLPHLIALSASSPFWQGDDTGLAACRPTVFESLPTSGTPYFVKNWAEFETLVEKLIHARAITSLKDLWWDIRPSPRYGTLEIRICDGIASLQETTAIVAFVHALCHWFQEHAEWMDTVPLPDRWMLRENKWRAIRHGLEAEIVVAGDGSCKSLRQDIEEWIEKITPYYNQLHYQEYLGALQQILHSGNSASRQREIFTSCGGDAEALRQVSLHNMREFNAGAPLKCDAHLQTQAVKSA